MKKLEGKQGRIILHVCPVTFLSIKDGIKHNVNSTAAKQGTDREDVDGDHRASGERNF